MLALTFLVASIGFADSINPSTVVPALYIAGARRGSGLGSFTLGVFVVYLAGGLALVLGPGPALIAALRSAGPGFEHAFEAVVGIGVLAFAVGLWRSRATEVDASPARPGLTRRSAFAIGAGITAVELPTALPYFGAVSAILASGAGAGVRILLVVAYNLLFVLPLVAILVLRGRLEPRCASLMAWIRRVAAPALAGVAAVGGAALIAVGTAGLMA